MNEPTISFSILDDKEKQIKEILTSVYNALKQKGYNPINQIVGYILSEDPTYITTHNNARSLIRKIDRDELLQVLVKSYLSEWFFYAAEFLSPWLRDFLILIFLITSNCYAKYLNIYIMS